MIIGIDLGFKGAIACVGKDWTEVKDMPVIPVMKGKKERLEYDLAKIKDVIDLMLIRDNDVYVVIEKVAPVMAKFGVSSGASNFHLGYGLGILEMLMESYGLSYELVTAKEWQKSFGIIKPKDLTEEQKKKWSTKPLVYEVAHKLFPEIELMTKRGRLLDGRSDALLIAEYGRRKWETK